MHMNEAVHRTHCCLKHGCKYHNGWGDVEYCPVEDGRIQQDYPCEFCLSVEDAEEDLRRAQEALDWAKLVRTFIPKEDEE